MTITDQARRPMTDTQQTNAALIAEARAELHELEGVLNHTYALKLITALEASEAKIAALEADAARWREVAGEAHTLTVYHADYVTGELIKRQHINRAAKVLSNRVRSLIDAALTRNEQESDQ